jgi:predicted PurR-regulated permease PerM
MNEIQPVPVIVQTPSHEAAARTVSTRTTRLAFGIALVAIGLWVARDLLLPLTWAVIIVVTVWPLYQRTFHRLAGRQSSLAPLWFTGLTGLVLLLPLGFVTFVAGREAVSWAGWIAQAQQHGISPPEWLARLPLLGNRLLAWWRAHLSDPRAASHLLDRVNPGALANWVSVFGAQLVEIAIFLLVTLLGIYVLLRDGERLRRRALALADQLLGDMGERFAERLVLAVRGTVAGTVLVALGEGALISIGYVIAGVPRPTLFGAVTVICAMLPSGAWVTFAVASLLLFAQGHAIAAAGLFGFGAAVALVGDHVVQPKLIGGRTELPFLWAIVGIFGGLATFGLVGLFLGPVIMAAVLMIWHELFEADPKPDRQSA